MLPESIQAVADRWLTDHPDVRNLCGEATRHLWLEAGLEPRSGWWDGQPHCWNVDADGTIYDLTRSQFTGEPPHLSVLAPGYPEARWTYAEATPEDLAPLRLDSDGKVLR